MAKKKSRPRSPFQPPLSTTPKLLARKLSILPRPPCQASSSEIGSSPLSDQAPISSPLPSFEDFPALPSRISSFPSAAVDLVPSASPLLAAAAASRSVLAAAVAAPSATPTVGQRVPPAAGEPSTGGELPAGRVLPSAAIDAPNMSPQGPADDQIMTDANPQSQPLASSLPKSHGPGFLKPSWSDLVKGTTSTSKMRKKGEAFVLDSGETCVQIPNSVIQRNEHRWNDFIIGQFQGNAPPPGLFHAIVNGIWSPKLKNISISKLSGKAYLIKIPCPVTRKRIIGQGMWIIEKQTMFVAKWEPGLFPAVPELTSAPVWLDFHDVPLQFYSQEGLEYIAGLVGEPLLLHSSTANMTNLAVARVFTVIDPTKPLPEVVNVRFESGHVHRIRVTCQWLPSICVHCNETGHSIKRCPTAPSTCDRCKATSHITENCSKGISLKAKNPPMTGRTKATTKRKSSAKSSLVISSLRDEAVIAPNLVPIPAPAAKVSSTEIDNGLQKLQDYLPYHSAQDKKKGKVVSSPATSSASETFSESDFEVAPSSDEDVTISKLFQTGTSRRDRRLQKMLQDKRGKGPTIQ